MAEQVKDEDMREVNR